VPRAWAGGTVAERGRGRPAGGGRRLRPLLAATLLLALSGWTGSGAASRGEADRLFREAAKQYEEQRFAQSLETYRGVLAAGYASPELLLNLGNASYRAGEPGWAVYYYELARRRSPSDPDIASNIRLAQRAALGAEPVMEGSALLDLLGRAQNRLTARQTVWVGAGLLWIAMTLLAVSWHWTPVGRRRLLPAAALIAASLGALLLATKIAQVSFAPDALVVEAASARAEPSDDATVEFRLPAGSPVQLARRAPGWQEVVLSKSLRGWVRYEEVADFARPR